MWTITKVLQNFFTHRDFLPEPALLPGTLFTPLHLVFALVWALAVAAVCRWLHRKPEQTIRRCLAALWAVTVVLEPTKIIWETLTGAQVVFNWIGLLPLYPCSIFMYAMPFALWGKGQVRESACGYVCSLGLLGGLINFIYPANILCAYSCLSFAGMHTFFYHGTIVLCALTMLLSGYHKLTGITKFRQLLRPAVPFLIMSVVANLVNFSPVGSDYMFFRLESFFFAPLGAALPKWATVLIAYAAYFIIHALPYLPSYIANRRKVKVV